MRSWYGICELEQQFCLFCLISILVYRQNGVVALTLPEFNREKTLRLSGNELWLVHSLIRLETVKSKLNTGQFDVVEGIRTNCVDLQWRANASQYLGQTSFGLGKENWGWNWTERWIAARPWEVRVHSQLIHPRNTQAKQASKSQNEIKVPALVKSASPKVKKDDPTYG